MYGDRLGLWAELLAGTSLGFAENRDVGVVTGSGCIPDIVLSADSGHGKTWRRISAPMRACAMRRVPIQKVRSIPSTGSMAYAGPARPPGNFLKSPGAATVSYRHQNRGKSFEVAALTRAHHSITIHRFDARVAFLPFASKPFWGGRSRLHGCSESKLHGTDADTPIFPELRLCIGEIEILVVVAGGWWKRLLFW